MIDEASLNSWWSSVWVQAGILVIGAWLIQHFGEMVIKQIIRRTVRSTPLNHMSPIDEQKRRDTLVSVLATALRIIVVISTVYALTRLLFPRFDLAPIFASAGIVGIALGFGAQTLVKDFLAGFFIIIENQYRVGDVVDLEGAAGTVERITLRCTILRDINGNVHYMPNGNIMHTINKTKDFGKVYFTIAVNPENDLDKVAEVINKVGKRLAKDKMFADKIIEPPQFLNIGALNDVALEVNILGKTEAGAQWSVASEMKSRLVREFAKQDIELSQYADLKLPMPK